MKLESCEFRYLEISITTGFCYFYNPITIKYALALPPSLLLYPLFTQLQLILFNSSAIKDHSYPKSNLVNSTIKLDLVNGIGKVNFAEDLF